MKDCGADRAQSIDFLARRPAGFRVLTGEDAQYHEALADGADGAILLSAHLETEAFASVRTLMKQGDRDGALACWKAISGLTRLLFAEPSPAPAKYWLARSGLIDSAEVRLPMVEVSAELAAWLDRGDRAAQASRLLRRRVATSLPGEMRKPPARPGWPARRRRAISLVNAAGDRSLHSARSRAPSTKIGELMTPSRTSCASMTDKFAESEISDRASTPRECMTFCWCRPLRCGRC